MEEEEEQQHSPPSPPPPQTRSRRRGGRLKRRMLIQQESEEEEAEIPVDDEDAATIARNKRNRIADDSPPASPPATTTALTTTTTTEERPRKTVEDLKKFLLKLLGKKKDVRHDTAGFYSLHPNTWYLEVAPKSKDHKLLLDFLYQPVIWPAAMLLGDDAVGSTLKSLYLSLHGLNENINTNTNRYCRFFLDVDACDNWSALVRVVKDICNVMKKQLVPQPEIAVWFLRCWQRPIEVSKTGEPITRPQWQDKYHVIFDGPVLTHSYIRSLFHTVFGVGSAWITRPSSGPLPPKYIDPEPTVKGTLRMPEMLNKWNSSYHLWAVWNVSFTTGYVVGNACYDMTDEPQKYLNAAAIRDKRQLEDFAEHMRRCCIYYCTDQQLYHHKPAPGSRLRHELDQRTGGRLGAAPNNRDITESVAEPDRLTIAANQFNSKMWLEPKDRWSLITMKKIIADVIREESTRATATWEDNPNAVVYDNTLNKVLDRMNNYVVQVESSSDVYVKSCTKLEDGRVVVNWTRQGTSDFIKSYCIMLKVAAGSPSEIDVDEEDDEEEEEEVPKKKKTKATNVAKRWLEYTNRNTKELVDYSPYPIGHPLAAEHYVLNLWHWTMLTEAECIAYQAFDLFPFLDALFRLLDCNWQSYFWTLDFFTRVFNWPYEKQGINVLLVGDPGVGKSQITQYFTKLFAGNAVFLTNTDQLHNFNHLIVNQCLVVFDDAILRTDSIKSFTTHTGKIPITRKYSDTVLMENCLNFIIVFEQQDMKNKVQNIGRREQIFQCKDLNQNWDKEQRVKYWDHFSKYLQCQAAIRAFAAYLIKRKNTMLNAVRHYVPGQIPLHANTEIREEALSLDGANSVVRWCMHCVKTASQVDFETYLHRSDAMNEDIMRQNLICDNVESFITGNRENDIVGYFEEIDEETKLVDPNDTSKGTQCRYLDSDYLGVLKALSPTNLTEALTSAATYQWWDKAKHDTFVCHKIKATRNPILDAGAKHPWFSRLPFHVVYLSYKIFCNQNSDVCKPQEEFKQILQQCFKVSFSAPVAVSHREIRKDGTPTSHRASLETIVEFPPYALVRKNFSDAKFLVLDRRARIKDTDTFKRDLVGMDADLRDKLIEFNKKPMEQQWPVTYLDSLTKWKPVYTPPTSRDNSEDQDSVEVDPQTQLEQFTETRFRERFVSRDNEPRVDEDGLPLNDEEELYAEWFQRHRNDPDLLGARREGGFYPPDYRPVVMHADRRRNNNNINNNNNNNNAVMENDAAQQAAILDSLRMDTFDDNLVFD